MPSVKPQHYCQTSQALAHSPCRDDTGLVFAVTLEKQCAQTTNNDRQASLKVTLLSSKQPCVKKYAETCCIKSKSRHLPSNPQKMRCGLAAVTEINHFAVRAEPITCAHVQVHVSRWVCDKRLMKPDVCISLLWQMCDGSGKRAFCFWELTQLLRQKCWPLKKRHRIYSFTTKHQNAVVLEL